MFFRYFTNILKVQLSSYKEKNRLLRYVFFDFSHPHGQAGKAFVLFYGVKEDDSCDPLVM